VIPATLLLATAVLAPDNGPGVVVVMPPEGRATGVDHAWVAEAVADALPRALARLGSPVVFRDDRLRAQEALEIPSVTLTRASSIRIAEALGASRLVVGTYEARDGALWLALRLLDAERGTLSAPFLASGPLESTPSVIHAIAWDLALAGPHRPSMSREAFLAGASSVPFEAFLRYAQALGGRDAAARVKLLREALARAPGFDEARVALGRVQLQTRDHQAARETLARVPDPSPLAREARFLQGLALIELGRYREAAALYGRLVQDEVSPATLNNHAVALLRVGGAPAVKASQVFRKALELDPESTEITFNLGWALLVEGDAEASAFWLRGITRREPRDAHARVVLAWALRRAGRASEADEEWSGVVAGTPSFESLAIPDLTRRFERALLTEHAVALDRAERTDAELAAAHAGRAEAQLAGGDVATALQELTRAAYLDPYSARVHRLLARAHLAVGGKWKAVSELQMSLWCDDDPEVRVELARLLLDLGRKAEARAEAERVLKADPKNEAARAILEGR
jgi:tetratricopeptide (TPR) repeat protein